MNRFLCKLLSFLKRRSSVESGPAGKMIDRGFRKVCNIECRIAGKKYPMPVTNQQADRATKCASEGGEKAERERRETKRTQCHLISWTHRMLTLGE